MSKLNKSQKQAIEIVDGPALVVAGAGTGKTKVIVERIARLIESGIPKQNILALTFTEKAAQEMLDRVGEVLEQSYGVEMNICTFNSFGQEILREYAVEIGISPNLQLVGDSGKVVLLRENLDKLGLDYFSPISSPDSQLALISDYFSTLKQQLVQPDTYRTFANGLPSSTEEDQLEKQRHTELATAYSAYIEITRSKNIIDYDDQLYLLVELLESRPNVLKKLQERYTHILVDEFQDTNPMQSRILDLLAATHQNIMVVGDDDQSIYGWRGATLANILEFKKRYPKAQEITLLENFRSTQQILDHAYRMIQFNNPHRLEAIDGLNKKLQAHRGTGQKPAAFRFSLLDNELAWVARDIQQRIKKGTEPGSIAVLARRNSTVQRMHQQLDSLGIDHTIAGISSDMYKQPIVATMIEALKCIVDQHDNQAMYHTLSGSLFNFDPTALGSIAARARKSHIDLYEALQDDNDPTYQAALAHITNWRATAQQSSVSSLAYKILTDSGFKSELYAQAAQDEKSAYMLQALGQWFVSLRDFEQVVDVASAVSYLLNLEALKAEGETLSDDSVEMDSTVPIVMSVHKAKGLEWETVYVIDCTENSFPLRRFGSSLELPSELSKHSEADDHYNEERRLMYVAATRARDQLVITYSESHNGVTSRKPSQFLEELFGSIDSAFSDNESLQTSLELFSSPDNMPNSVHIPAAMRSGDNLVLTASQATDYLRCPLDFKYRHILNVPPEPDPSRAVGVLLHTIIQEINDARMQGSQPADQETFISRLHSLWPTEGYLSATQRKRALDSASKTFANLYKRLLAEPAPIASEAAFRVHIPNSALILKGRIDVVLPSKNGVEIRDYKTSTSTQTPDKAKKSAQSSKQLEMYALAWRIQHGELPSVVSLDFVQTGMIGQVKKQPKTIDNLESTLASLAQDILQGKFPEGRDHRYCQHPLSS